ncbi:hypothetical protein ACFWXH_14100 [Mesorhizobium sp. NPDC059054]|uniref:hypothetical protein n=1 Tax=Mesorhizobium sp. NPDC059054 TaxID=3346711 RepID=UPI003686D48F
MAENDKPVIRLIGFRTTYEKLPVRGTDPLKDKVDAQGFLLNEAGKRLIEPQEVDWAIYAPGHSPLGTHTVERVKHLVPDPDRHGDDLDGTKLAFMTARWEKIRPAYEAWKAGKELPASGTPLTAWPALNEEQVRILRQVGIQSVEEIRDLAETQIGRVPLPNMRELIKQAGVFLGNLDSSAMAEREAKKDEEISDLKERLAELEKLLDGRAKPVATTTEPPASEELASLRAELDTRGIAYDKRWAAPKLRAALAEAA